MKRRAIEWIDHTTNTLSQDCFTFLLELEAKRAMRYNYFISLLTIEMDQSENGEILIKLADLIQQNIRETDILSRSDSRRFSVILHYAETRDTFGVGERIRNHVVNYNFIFNKVIYKRTVSIGGACFPTHTSDPHDLLLIANEMLSKAKNAGGNKVGLPSK